MKSPCQLVALSLQLSSVESWQRAFLSVDVPGLQYSTCMLNTPAFCVFLGMLDTFDDSDLSLLTSTLFESNAIVI